MMITVAVIMGLILLNAIFVAAEFAIVGVPKASIERKARQGHRRARQVRKILHDPMLQDRYIATAQLGITFASLGLGMYGEHMLAQWFGSAMESMSPPQWLAVHAVDSILAVAVLTYFHIVFGEMVPKSIALQFGERTALFINPVMNWVRTLLHPLVIILNGLGNGVLKLMRVDRKITVGHYLTSEELRYIVSESEQGGLIRAESGQVLRDLLEFGELTAAEVMVPRVRIVGIPLNSSTSDLKQIVKESPHSRYPVFEGDLDHILGMVHIKDILRLILEDLSLTKENLRHVPYVPETSRLDSVLAGMRRRRTHLVVVMDEYGGTAGVITIEDLFEEVVGDIEGGAPGHDRIYQDAQGRTRVPGTMRLEELGDYLGLALEHEDVYTVSGLVLMLLNRQPRIGNTVTFAGLRFEVAAVRGHGVEECIVSVLSNQEPKGVA